MNNPTITIKPSERWVILGKTGSGKTAFAKYMLRLLQGKMRIVIVDPKEYWLGDNPVWASRKEEGTVDKPRLVQTFDPKLSVQCLQPDEEEDDSLEKLCREVLKTRRTFMYFDETEGIATAHHVPGYLRRIWKTGRALKVGAWVSTQAPTGIPKIFKSQAEKFFVFKVGEEDKPLAASFAHVDISTFGQLRDYEYFYYDTIMDKGIHMPPVPFKEK